MVWFCHVLISFFCPIPSFFEGDKSSQTTLGGTYLPFLSMWLLLSSRFNERRLGFKLSAQQNELE